MAQASFRIAKAMSGKVDTAAAASPPLGRFALLERDAAVGIAGEWRSLTERAAEDNAFFDPDFALPAMVAIGDGVTIATWRSEDGRLAALAPVRAARLGRIAPALRVWSHDYGPLGVPLVDRTMTDRAVDGLLDGLMEAGGSVVLPDITLEGPVALAVTRHAAAAGRGLAVVDSHRRAMLQRPESGNVDCRAALPQRRRKEYSRQMRRLADLGEVVVETASEPGEVKARFEEFLLLEAAGWKGKRHTALAELPPIAALAREIVGRRAAAGAVRIDSIRLDGRPIAMLVSFLSGATAYSWKIAYDEAYEKVSPGAQLMLDAGGTLLSNAGIRRIDSCASANHPMIDHLWHERLAIGTLVIGPAGGGLLHAAGLAAMKAEIRARGLAHRVLRRFGRHG
jgi:CelD/BcsL family acetyltransferase involved in cellulose biosynthesis